MFGPFFYKWNKSCGLFYIPIVISYCIWKKIFCAFLFLLNRNSYSHIKLYITCRTCRTAHHRTEWLDIRMDDERSPKPPKLVYSSLTHSAQWGASSDTYQCVGGGTGELVDKRYDNRNYRHCLSNHRNDYDVHLKTLKRQLLFIRRHHIDQWRADVIVVKQNWLLLVLKCGVKFVWVTSKVIYPLGNCAYRVVEVRRLLNVWNA